MPRSMRTVILLCVMLAFGYLLFLVVTTRRRPGRVYLGSAWNSRQAVYHSVDNEFTAISLAEVVSSETKSPHSPRVNADVGRTAKRREQSQPRTTTATSETPTANAVTPLSIHLVIVLFRNISNDTKVLFRQQEQATVLQRNLNHPLISSIHVMTADKEDMEEYLRGLELPNRHKIVVVESKQWDMVRGIFQYISDNLVGKDAMYANGDIYLGKGFEKVDANVLSSRNILYSLTRLGKQEESCKMKDYCGGDLDYVGSHDVFLFHLKEPLPEEALKVLEYEIWSYGTENVLMGVFKRLLYYCILNPCKILETYHLHCSELRHTDAKRVNWDSPFNTISPITKNLTC